MSHSASSPSACDRNEHLGLFLYELGLLLRREFYVAVALFFRSKGCEDSAPDAEIGRAHMGTFFRAGQAQSNPAKVRCVHAFHSCFANRGAGAGRHDAKLQSMPAKHPRVEIEYCTQCRWLLRAAWMAQELLTTFQTEVGEIALVPGTGGVFEVRVDEVTVWSRSGEGRFPEMKEMKQRIRDVIAPERDLGHSDV
jgi:selenoprotein W-related protein